MNTLTEDLLTKTDIDRLLVASPGEGLHTALKETYLAPYLLKVEEDVAEAIEMQLLEARNLIGAIAPRLLPVELLWVQHDIHNLRLFAKAAGAGLSYEALESHMSTRGSFKPAYLFERAQNQSLNGLEAGWQEAYDNAVRSMEGEGGSVDTVFDRLYFKTIERKAQASGDAFLKRFTKTLIDLYNLKARLRTLAYPQVATGVEHIQGGSFAASEIETKEQIMAGYQSLGGEAFWREAVEAYLTTGNTTQLDARADDYLLTMTREAAYDMFSTASLVLYYLRSKQAAANIRTVITLRDGGLGEDRIRPNLRVAYVKE